MTADEVASIAQQIAEEEIGGPSPRCTGHKADRYNAAYNAVVKVARLFAAPHVPGRDLKASAASARATAQHLKALGRRRDG